MKYSLRSLMIVATFVMANAIWGLLVTVWAQSLEHRWLPTSSIKPEYLDGAAGGVAFVLATWFVLSSGRLWKKLGWVAVWMLFLETIYLGVDQLYRRYADWMFGIDPLVFTIRLSVTLAAVIPLLLVWKETEVIPTTDSPALHPSLPGQFTIRQLWAWVTLLAVYCAVLRLLAKTDPFAPATNTLSTQVVMSIRWQLWFLSAAIWSISPVAWAITRRRRLSRQAWLLVVVGTLVTIPTAFPLFSYLGRYLNGVWNNPQQRLLTGLLLPFLLGFMTTTILNLLALAKLGLLSRKAPE